MMTNKEYVSVSYIFFCLFVELVISNRRKIIVCQEDAGREGISNYSFILDGGIASLSLVRRRRRPRRVVTMKRRWDSTSGQ